MELAVLRVFHCLEFGAHWSFEDVHRVVIVQTHMALLQLLGLFKARLLGLEKRALHNVKELQDLLVVLCLFDGNFKAVKLEMGAFTDRLLLLVAEGSFE